MFNSILILSKNLRFTIDFATPGGIALHFNPRWKDKTIVRNTLFHGTWGSEERSSAWPFKSRQAFELIITLDEEKYTVKLIFKKNILLFSYKVIILSLQLMVSIY